MEEGFNQAMSQAIDKINTDWEQKLDEAKRQNDQLKAKEWEYEDKLKARTSELEKDRSRHEQQLEKRDRDIDALNQKLWSLEQEVRTERDKGETLKRHLDERRDDIVSLKEQLNASMEKEQRLKREMLRLQLQEEKDDDDRARRIAEENEKIIKGLQEQKKEANAIMEDQRQQIEELRRSVREMQRKNEFLTQRIQILDGQDSSSNLYGTSINNDNNLVFGATYNTVDKDRTDSPRRRTRTSVERDIDDELGFSSLPPASPLPSGILESARFLDHNSSFGGHTGRTHAPDNDSHLSVALERAEHNIREKDRRIDQLQQEILQLTKRLGGEDSSVSNDQNTLLRQLTDQISALQQELELRKDVTDSSSFTKLNTILTDLRVDNERYKDKLSRAENKNESLISENRTLKSKLKEAARDLRRLMKEREKLIDVSNGVRAELDRTREQLHQQSISGNLNTRATQASHVHEVQTQSDLRHFKDEVSRLQSSLREVIENNTALKRELQRWTGQHFEDISNMGHRRPSTGGRLSEQLYPLLNADGLFGVSNNSGMNDTLNGNSAVLTGANTSDLSRPRQKLETIRESLTMTGRPSVMHPAEPGSALVNSERQTESQKQALKRIQKKKAELVPQRKALRRMFK